MSDAGRQISDERLTAYLDGALGAEARADLETAVAMDPDLAARLAALDLPLEALRTVMAPKVLGAPRMPEGLIPPTAEPVTRNEPVSIATPARSRRLWVPAAIAASFAAGIAVSTLLITPPPGPAPAATTKWVDAVASYQALYMTETLEMTAQDPRRAALVLESAGQDFSLSLEPALDLEGLDFKRAQMLGWNGKPLLQMAYLAADGTPIALCLTRVSAEDRGPKTSISHDLAGVSWVRDGVGYYLIGGQSEGQVEALSAQVMALL